MSATRLFASYKRLATKTEIAMQITMDTIEEHEESRRGREDQPWDAHDRDRMNRLAALLTGPHHEAVRPIVERLWPDFVKACEQPVGTA